MYFGDSNFAYSFSNPLTFEVNFGSEFYLTPSFLPNPATAGELITAEIHVAEGEDVTVCEGSTALGHSRLSRDAGDWPRGFVEVPLPSLPVGTHNITASLAGCPADLNVSTVETLVVLPGPATSSSPPTSHHAPGGKPAGATGTTTTGTTGVKTTPPPAVKTVHGATTSTSASKVAYADPTTTQPGPSLASTGAPVGPQITVALTAFALGTLLLLIGRRRDRTTRGH
jgi:hypothetical protein